MIHVATLPRLLRQRGTSVQGRVIDESKCVLKLLVLTGTELARKSKPKHVLMQTNPIEVCEHRAQARPICSAAERVSCKRLGSYLYYTVRLYSSSNQTQNVK